MNTGTLFDNNLQPKFISDPGALYHKEPKLIAQTIKRVTSIERPKGQSNGLTANSEAEFHITHDQFEDLASFRLVFNLKAVEADGSATAAKTAYINNAMDAVRGTLSEYNDITIQDNREHLNIWGNQFIAYTANDSWTSREGTALLGYNHPALQKGNQKASDVSGAGREFVVPLCLLHGVYRSSSYFPVVNGRLVIKITFDDVAKVLSLSPDKDDSYVLDKVRLVHDTVHLENQYRNSVVNMMAAGGFQIPFVDYYTEKITPATSDLQQIRIEKKFSNALSIFVIRDNKKNKEKTANKHTAYCQSFPLTDIERVLVNSNELYFTPRQGITSYAELYASTEMSVNALCDLSGTGIIDWNTHTSGYSKRENLNSEYKAAVVGVGAEGEANYVAASPELLAAEYGTCLVGISLEKTVETDEGVINNGYTTGYLGAGATLRMELKTENPLSEADDLLLVNVVHKRVITFAGGNMMVSE